MIDCSNTPNQDDLNVYFCGFHNLMPYRVQHILLVSSLYESFILEGEGLITELITSEYLDMNLSHAPRVSRVSTAQEALEFIGEQPVDLVITMTRLGDLSIAEFAEAVKWRKPDLPVVVLADEPRAITRNPKLRESEHIDRTFVWNGDARILLAIIKFVEDRINAEHDTKVGNVRVIILVENSVRFYSTYLPAIYTELMNLTQSLITESVNLTHKLLRMRARPRVLLAETYEEAWALYNQYGENLLGVISDIRFPKDGESCETAGIEFTRKIREQNHHLPVLLQSSDPSFAQAADEIEACFLHKNSRHLLRHLREFMLRNLGFGDFVFKNSSGHELDRAHDLRELEEKIAHVPVESLAFHAAHNHFSNWLMARTEFELAARLRPAQVSDFPSLEELRRYLISTLKEFREKAQTGVITDFSPNKFDVTSSFTRIGGGSLGGKARGLAFVNALIRRHNLARRFEGVKIFVPKTVVLGTEVFDRFLDNNNLRGVVAEDIPDERLIRILLAAKLPKSVHQDLTAFLRQVEYPLAVRSSSLLEDSQGQPFAGIYSTHMIPNNHPDISVRLDQLCDAIKRVYASTFTQSSKRYLEATGRNAEEEKMGVILQEIVGSQHDNRFYPTFSGVARSYNFYPTEQMNPAEGVANVALGLGKMVVEGGQSLTFSPAHPEILPQFPTTEDTLANSQRKFYALDTSHPEVYPSADTEANHLLLDLDVAEKDGTLAPIGSVYDPQNEAVYDGINRQGPRLVTFAHVLKSDVFPLAEILKVLLEIGQEGTAGPVEMEFAVDMSATPMEFGFLQIRPIILHEEYEDVCLDDVSPGKVICYSNKALGNGQIHDVRDIVYVKPDTFDSTYTREIAAEIGQINADLHKQERSTIFIGPGRWGTADRWLGIPVTWEQISTAHVMIETTLTDFMVAPSQGTHFFQNLTSLGMGYLMIDPNLDQGSINWKWLAKQPAIRETDYVRHVQFEHELEIRLDGRRQRAAVFRPDL